MTTTPDPAAPVEDQTAPVEDQTKPTMTGAVPLVPLGRPQVAAAARLAASGARHPVRLARAGLRLTGELASAARGTSKREPQPGDREPGQAARMRLEVIRGGGVGGCQARRPASRRRSTGSRRARTCWARG